VRVRSLSGTFGVTGASINSGAGAGSGPALEVFEMAGMAGGETTATPDSVASGATASDITRGPGLQPTTATAFGGGYISTPVGNVWATDLASSITKNQYVTFTLQASSGRKISLDRIDFTTYNQNSKPTFGAALQYSTDGVNFTNVTLSGAHPDFSANLSGIAPLQNTTATVTFRIYFWGNGNFEAVGLGRLPGNDLVVYGSTRTALTAFQQDSTADHLVVMEAENYHDNVSVGGKTWTPFTGTAGYSGTGALEASPNTGTQIDTGYVGTSPRLDYNVNFVTTGVHYIWLRNNAAAGTDDSAHVGLDGAAVSTADRVQGTTNSWQWSHNTMDGVVATINITTPGIHTINVWMREDGFRLDKLLITTNSAYTPSGAGPAESAHAPLVSNLTSTSGRTYSLGNSLNVGDVVYTDRSYTYTGVPSLVAGSQFIQTANDDKTSNAATMFSFSLSADADVFVAYDTRETSLPNWLNDGTWVDTGVSLNLSGGETMRLYKKHFAAGTVSLGGNLAAGAAGAATNYTVVVQG
jgi:hypothetical protein